MSGRTLSLSQARRVALAAQGFADRPPAPGSATMRHVQRVIDRVRVVQIDSVNVLVRSQYLPFFSRLGPYDVSLLDRARDRPPRRLVEYWAHEASLVQPQLWPLLGFRMRRAHELAWGGMRQVAIEHPALVESVREHVERDGPFTSRQLERVLEHDEALRRSEWGWNWSLVKAALEHLFWAGEISSAGRTPQFERRYASLGAVLPASVLPDARAALLPRAQPTDPDADPNADEFRDLMLAAAQAHGIGSEQCLRDYFRLWPEQARPALQRLVEEGELLPVTVTGWKRPAFLHKDARLPRRVHAEALLSPFDSLIWQRDRTAALWGFDYRLEIYVPAAKRVYGYYVLPFLYGEHLVARVDLKADRAAGRLLVRSVHWEPGAPAQAHPALDRQLSDLAGWLDLEVVAAG